VSQLGIGNAAYRPRAHSGSSPIGSQRLARAYVPMSLLVRRRRTSSRPSTLPDVLRRPGALTGLRPADAPAPSLHGRRRVVFGRGTKCVQAHNPALCCGDYVPTRSAASAWIAGTVRAAALFQARKCHVEAAQPTPCEDFPSIYQSAGSSLGPTERSEGGSGCLCRELVKRPPAMFDRACRWASHTSWCLVPWSWGPLLGVGYGPSPRPRPPGSSPR
jgi:hypothetical protein